MQDILDDENLKKNGAPEEVRFARFWTRVGARLLDAIIMLPLILIGIFNMLDWKSLPLFLVVQLAAMLYKPWLEAEYGATLGKMIVKIKVVTTDFQDIDLQQSLNRYIFYFAAAFMALVGGVMLFMHEDFMSSSDFLVLGELQAQAGMPNLTQFLNLVIFVSCVFCAFDLNKQTLHDKVAKTYVIHTD